MMSSATSNIRFFCHDQIFHYSVESIKVSELLKIRGSTDLTFKKFWQDHIKETTLERADFTAVDVCNRAKRREKFLYF